MSYYNNDAIQMYIRSADNEKDVLQALADAEMKDHPAKPIVNSYELKERLVDGKKISSATLLRKKLSGGLKRELREL